MKKKPVEIVEIEEDGTPYAVTCKHGVHFGGYNCVFCHPEKMSAFEWFFSPEMDVQLARLPSAGTGERG